MLKIWIVIVYTLLMLTNVQAAEVGSGDKGDKVAIILIVQLGAWG